jgi:hypothetical protein
MPTIIEQGSSEDDSVTGPPLLLGCYAQGAVPPIILSLIVGIDGNSAFFLSGKSIKANASSLHPTLAAFIPVS